MVEIWGIMSDNSSMNDNERPTIIRLSAVESRRLRKAMLSPPRKPSARMKRALKQYRETVISDVNPERVKTP